jgi:hypothetical protein
VDPINQGQKENLPGIKGRVEVHHLFRTQWNTHRIRTNKRIKLFYALRFILFSMEISFIVPGVWAYLWR